jgi:hypothetical protein
LCPTAGLEAVVFRVVAPGLTTVAGRFLAAGARTLFVEAVAALFLGREGLGLVGLVFLIVTPARRADGSFRLKPAPCGREP